MNVNSMLNDELLHTFLKVIFIFTVHYPYQQQV